MDEMARPIGPSVAFGGATWPSGRQLRGRFVELVRIDVARHGPDIWAQVRDHEYVWDYLFEPAPQDATEFDAGLSASASKSDWLGYAICVNGKAMGYAFFLNINTAMGSIEVGNINLSPALQQTCAATEAMYLMMQEAFALGYRRYEWKCNALNRPSRRAAQRFGFSYEGIFRQHMIVKGRNRDTAWFAMTDAQWPDLDAAFRAWLSPENFTRDAQQRQSLRSLTAPHRVAGDPDQTDD